MDAMARIDPLPLYPPSWFDRFSAWIDRFPGPAWPYFLGGALASGAAFVGVQASQGAYIERGLFPWHIFLALQPVFILAMMHYLDHAAIAALARFRPVMGPNDPSFAETRHRLTTLPARPTWIATVAGVLASVALFGPSYGAPSPSSAIAAYPTALQAFRLSETPLSLFTVTLTFLLMWALIGVFVYHTVHQLNVVRGLFIPEAPVNPFHPQPLYAFSSLTGLTGGLILLNSYGWLWGIFAGPARVETISIAPALVVNVFFAALSLTLFIWPMWGAHRILSNSKQQALARIADLYLTATAELHRKVGATQVQDIDDWHKALAALDLERSQIEILPTWPWRPETLRGLVAAILLPTVIWLLQRLLDRLMG